MPIDGYLKKQNTIETSMFGSKFVAARVATDQIINPHLTLRYMGVPLGRSIMFGDNESVVKNSTTPTSHLAEWHVALSYHQVREVVVTNVFSFFHIPGQLNPADILSEHWGHQQVWNALQPLLFWKANTVILLMDMKPNTKGGGNPVQNIGE